jgi:hypothetical protein
LITDAALRSVVAAPGAAPAAAALPAVVAAPVVAPASKTSRTLDAYYRVVTGSGEIVLNVSNSSIDAHCFRCGATRDLKFTARQRAKAPRTLAQGRPLGSEMLWLNLDPPCSGDECAHLALWSDESLPHLERAYWRVIANEDGAYAPLIAKERPPTDDEVDGEPTVVPGLLR